MLCKTADRYRFVYVTLFDTKDCMQGKITKTVERKDTGFTAH